MSSRRFVAVAILAVVIGAFALGDRDGDGDGNRVGEAVGDGRAVIFEGYDPLWQANTIIVRRDGRYYLDGDAMEERRRRNMPADGLALVLGDRRGEPDNYFLVRSGRMEVYTGCEYGPCTLKRTIRE